MNPQIDEIVKSINEYIRLNAIGLVCECGGGGTEGSDTCEKCNGCGVYRWSIFEIDKIISKSFQQLSDAKDKEWMLQVKSALDDENKIWQKKAEEARIEQIEKDAKIAKEEFEDMRIDLEVWHGNKIKLKDDCSIANKIRGQLSELETPTEKL